MWRTSLALLGALALGLPPAVPAPQRPGPPDPELLAGIRQVKEGDFETAVLTLDGVARRLSAEPDRSQDLAQAYLYLGIAYLALDQPGAAEERFRSALLHDRELRLSPERFSPKVIAAFEAARASDRPGASKRGGKTGLVVLGVGAAAAAGVAIAAGGGGTEAPAGAVDFVNARFGTPVIECPNDSFGAPIEYTIVVEGTNDGTRPVVIDSVSATIRIESSSFPDEIGLANNQPSTVAPGTIPGRSRQTFTVESHLLCSNASGNPARFNEWSGTVTLVTSAGVFTRTTSDRLHVNIP